MDDRTIINLLWNRAESALSALAGRFGRGLYQLACNILGNPQDAEESVSDTYLAVWNAIPPDRPEKLPPYVYRIGRNRALNRRRENTALKRGSSYDLSLEELAESLPGGDLEETVDARFLGQSIDLFLSRLSSTNRILFLRRYWFGDSVQELAAAFHMKPNAVSVRLSRIRSDLRKHLCKEGICV